MCGKRSESLKFQNVVRPEPLDGGGYQCPSGYEACQPSWLTDATKLQYVVCVTDSIDLNANCPITSFAFTLDGMEASEAAMYTKATIYGD